MAEQACCGEECCWICLDGEERGELRHVCQCPRLVHEACLARWQLHSAGKSEERHCRFCNSPLQDWKTHMTSSSKVVTPYMRVSFNGRTHKVQVKPGEDGQKEFATSIRKLLNLPEDQEFDVIFHCRAPGTGDKLQLQGLCAFDAAVHCASMSSWPSVQGAKQQPQRLSLTQRLFQRITSRLM